MAGESTSDRNLLVVAFALQLDFITRDQLVDCLEAWMREASETFEHLLISKGLLNESDRELLAAQVERHLAQHGGGVLDQNLKSFSKDCSSVDLLGQIDDPAVSKRPNSVSLVSTVIGNEVPPTASFHESDTGSPSALGHPSRTRYLALRPHAKGGLGEVFLARDTELDREVALKEIQGRHAHDTGSRSRFVIEAEITGKLEHPGIVPVYGLGAYSDGRPYYAMKFIRGESLQEAIERFHNGHESGEMGSGNPYESVAFRKLLGRFVDVCQAVGFAHERGVLHRDL